VNGLKIGTTNENSIRKWSQIMENQVLVCPTQIIAGARVPSPTGRPMG